LKLAGKTALITGASSGIGLETARLFRNEGAGVAIIARDRARLDRALADLGPDAIAEQADVTQPQALAGAIARAGASLGGIDILCINAGGSGAPQFAETTVDAFDAIMNLNVRSAIFTVVHALPVLRDKASIVLTGSVAGRKGWPGDPLYAATKGAIRSFGRALAVEQNILARGIRVNVVSPGATLTPLTKAAAERPDVYSYVADRIPMKRWGEPREVAQAILFLASDAASYITGEEITVDGGLAHV
jgi:NAD(P)-dependent dehydrogenase (short-subunit alcohol dehydrogenase family)